MSAPTYVSRTMLLREAQRNNKGVRIIASFDEIAKTDGRFGSMSFISNLDSNKDIVDKYSGMEYKDGKSYLDAFKETLAECAKCESIKVYEKPNRITGELRKVYELTQKNGKPIPIRLWCDKKEVANQEITGDDFKKVVFGFAVQDGDIVFNEEKLAGTQFTKTPKIFANVIPVLK